MSKYCQNTTLNHLVAQKNQCCIQKIDCIVKKESFHQGKEKCKDYQKVQFKEAQAINLDYVTREDSKSMDMVFGLKNNYFIGVELKLNAKQTPKNIKIKYLEDKKEYSIKTITEIECCILIYCNRQKQKQYLDSRLGKAKKEKIEQLGFKFMTIQKLHKIYF